MFRAILFFLMLPFCFVGCGKPKTKPPVASTIVLTSIPPYAFFIEKIAGDTVTVQTLVPAGANPHIFEPNPKQVEEANKAQLWLQIGEAFEKKITTVLKERNPSLVLVDLCEGISLLSSCDDTSHTHACSHEDGKDRHTWLSPKIAKKQAALIAESLSQLYPQNRELYTENLRRFTGDLEQLDQEIELLLHSMKGEAVLVSHPAFGYFCKDYDLIQVSVEYEGKDPLPQHIRSLFATIASSPVKSVLIQPQYNNKGAELIAEKLHLPIYLVDPYSSDYLTNLKNIASQIAHEPIVTSRY